MKLFKIIILILILTSLSSCASTKTEKSNKKELIVKNENVVPIASLFLCWVVSSFFILNLED